MEALAGTVIDLNGKFDHLNGKFDHLSCKLDRMMEELPGSRRDIDEPSRSRRDHDLSGCKLHQTTPLHHAPLHYSTAAPSLFSVQMCHSQIHAERIKILTLAFQKYKGDSKSPEEQLQILNAAAQKYQARRNLKATEEQPQLYSPSPPKYRTASYVFDEMHEREPETVDEALVTLTIVEPTDVVVIESTTSECLPVENEVAEKTNVEIDILALKRMVKSAVTGPQVVALIASATAFTPGGIFHQQDQTLIRFPIETHIFGGMQMGAPHPEDPWQIIWDPGIGSFNSEGLGLVADIAMNNSGTMLPYSGNEKVLLVWDPGINFLVSDSVLMQGISESFKLRTMWDPGILILLALHMKKFPGKKPIGLGVSLSSPTTVFDAYEKLLSSIPEFPDFGKLFKSSSPELVTISSSTATLVGGENAKVMKIGSRLIKCLKTMRRVQWYLDSERTLMYPGTYTARVQYSIYKLLR